MVECCAVALAARRLLAADGLTAFPKTSGAKGLHLLVPLHPVPERAATDYARRLAGQLRAAAPGLIVDRMEKSLAPRPDLRRLVPEHQCQDHRRPLLPPGRRASSGLHPRPLDRRGVLPPPH
ncbi:hypothetical protein GCM10020229_25980 [Kitasatospora albolonga]